VPSINRYFLTACETNQAAARLPEFVEPMKATLVDSMPAGSWIY
jgi:hypothetical protein